MIENDCNVTRVGAYNEILPEPSGNPSGSGNISSYTLPLVPIQLQVICWQGSLWVVPYVREVDIGRYLGSWGRPNLLLCNDLSNQAKLLRILHNLNSLSLTGMFGY